MLLNIAPTRTITSTHGRHCDRHTPSPPLATHTQLSNYPPMKIPPEQPAIGANPHTKISQLKSSNHHRITDACVLVHSSVLNFL
ncbi:hypothetical protein BDV93DRAFT_166432 [Ceratobasidium sp. AG-I]|nr:hypothetical protein BDV93DRAFT_166432 [Ceratobasidium sp. AG-I]